MRITVTLRRTTDISLIELTLLSAEEYGEYKRRIGVVKEKWWLKNGQAVCSSAEGGTCLCDIPANTRGVHIRPVIKFHSYTINVDDKFEMLGHVWTVISDDIAICNDVFCEMPFDEGAHGCAYKYNGSDVEIYLNNIVHDYNL